MLNRRELLTRTSLLSLAPSVPAFLAQSAGAARFGTAGRVLVVLQLDGGNDGLNTVIPLGSDDYRRARPSLAIATDKALRVSDEVGLHPALEGLATLLERGQLAIVQGVGYPNPNRSHDVSLATWHTARFEREDHKGFGWLGRALDQATPSRKGAPSAVVAGADPLPVALHARRAVSATVNTLDEYAEADLGALGGSSLAAGDDTEDFVRRTALDARSTVERLREVAGVTGKATQVPSTELARRLGLVAQMIRAGLETPVYYVVQRGYDTHELQAAPHARLLAELGNAVQGFFDDLAANDLGERVLLLTFSEFGRRVQENASYGTDHGAAAPLFLAGRGVRPGLHGSMPGLSDLDQGDLKSSLDFRAVYATVLEGWLGLGASAALNGTFAPLPLLKT